MTTFSNEQIRSAILRAADRMQSAPKKLVHENCLSREYKSGRGGCLLVHIGIELGEEDFGAQEIARILDGPAATINDNSVLSFINHSYEIRNDGRLAAPRLRAYADKYFPASPVASGLDPAFAQWRASFETSQVSA